MWETIFRVSSAILWSVGGAGAIILALSGWLGKIWAERILEKDRARYNTEIGKIKYNLDKELENHKSELEIAKLALSRYSSYQFDLYNKLWNSLCDLKFAGDKLWDEVNEERTLGFSNQLRKTKEYLIKSILLIEDEHYKQLNLLLGKFGNYEIGKWRLIKIGSSHKGDLAQALLAHNIIEDNASTKQEYDNLLLLIGESFKKQMRIPYIK